MSSVMYCTYFQLAEIKLAGMCSFQHQGGVVKASAPLSYLDGQKPVVVFLHGWQDNAASFDALFPLLADQYDLIAIDWPGHGHSEPRSKDNYYHFVDYIDDLNQLMTLIPMSDVILVGHSLGALVAGCYAAAFPDKVTGLVQIEGGSPLSEPTGNAVQRLRDGIDSRQRYRQRAVRRATRSMASFQDALDLRCSVNQLTAQQLQPLVERATYHDGRCWYWRHDNRLRCDSLYRMAREQAQALTSQIQCPVLSILGRTGFRSLKQPESGSGWLQHSTQVEIEGGHHCHIESPQAVCEHIRMFIEKFK
ncbi:alpha/beta hydrolase [Photobacterium sp. SDRW27]|uniref:alpha/beta fold hydrolase n=1 Tax=Photobacterium obscurum TaxID=2829490 RepID=UPI002244C3B9|nr:alpha/beta hydrolase [Photobacterium obscurum]MCW8327536.1 alpha/beta hydrolase [Photobacterium obscurum]